MKIALIGSAPSSVRLAPYNDPQWQIWACSPGSVAYLTRCDKFFEIHRWEPDKPWFNIEYRAWMATRQCPIYMIHPVHCVPMSVAYPKDEILEKYSPFFFTSSLSWMFALALEQKGVTDIGLWGVDMSAQEEWEFQRSGCHYFIDLAKRRGINVHIPPESDLLRPPTLYGFREVDPMHIKLQSRVEELQAHVNKASNDMQEARDRYHFFKGALDNNLYVIKTWVADPKALGLAYANPGPRLEINALIEESLKEEIAKENATPPPLMDNIIAEVETKPKKRTRKGVNGSHTEA